MFRYTNTHICSKNSIKGGFEFEIESKGDYLGGVGGNKGKGEMM